MERLLTILRRIQPDIDQNLDKKLIDDGVFDSFDIVLMVGEINREYGINIGVDQLIPENFNSVDAIKSLIESLQ